MATLVSYYQPNANMYGCLPCPQCKSRYRYQLARKPEEVVCDDCGFVEPAIKADDSP